MSSKDVTTAVVSEDVYSYEETYVHSVYEEIASHFSSTRYKPWPIVARFLSSMPTGWIGLDSGTGNGKYLPIPSEPPGTIWTIGVDRSQRLLEIAQTAGGTAREVVRVDVLDAPWRKGVFDYAISIATIHHLAAPIRRQRAVQTLLRAVAPTHGRILIYVWAVKQDGLSKRNIPHCGSDGQDVFVPWEYSSTVFQRYYHMFSEGELRRLVLAAAEELGLAIGFEQSCQAPEGIELIREGWERSNYYVELRRWKKTV